ncbi:MAG: hypothetical protein VBE63_20360 [Lamprobacter sp.]|uniref:hypothetical protein n=1 Tax=Lamprobacter sp. TaxID=3100796 RepID=UPI002B2624AA|nr:hypothetical protein [Lamprobacter sp.]MEA3642272.1 hypothetical protein [Lamprobacter sp.]
MTRVENQAYLLELNSDPPSWVDGSDGDPGRTCRRQHALRFQDLALALRESDRLSALFDRVISVVPFEQTGNTHTQEQHSL